MFALSILMNNLRKLTKTNSFEGFCTEVIDDFLNERNGSSSGADILLYNQSPVVLDRFRRKMLCELYQRGRQEIKVNFAYMLNNERQRELTMSGFYLVDIGWFIKNKMISDTPL
jgi:hypothetical protein